MIVTIIYAIYAFIMISLSAIVLVLPGIILRSVGLKQAGEKVISFASNTFPKLLFWGTGSKVTIRGLENFPSREDRKRICMVSNHQSYFDILLILGFLPGFISFVAKKELFRVPFLNIWMYGIGCIKLDRSSPRASVKAIEKGIQKIREGLPLLIFPEGTRSRSNKMADFKSGSLKLATRSEALILPLTVEGTAEIFEAHGKVGRSNVVLTVHPPLSTEGIGDAARKELAPTLRRMILEGGDSLVSKEGL